MADASRTPVVAVGVAKVWHANNRRYLTKRAAYRALATSMIRARCECEPSDDVGYPGYRCHYHRDSERFTALRNRLARFIQRCEASHG